MTIHLRFTDEDWSRIERDWTAWWAGELSRPMVIMPSYDNVFNRSRREMTREFLLEKSVDEVLSYYQARLEGAQYFGDSWPKWSPYFGPGIMTGYVGGRVEPMPEQRTVWFEATSPTPYEKLHFEYDAGNPWWRRTLDLAEGAVKRWGDRVNIAHTDIGGVLDILASFRTTNALLTDLYNYPDEVLRCGRELSALWARYYHEFAALASRTVRGSSSWAPLWARQDTYMLQCDFSFMISPRMFERFVLPDLDYCCRQMEQAFYHLDGKGQIPHVDMLLSLEHLRGIQWIPGAGQPPLSQWMSLLQKIRDAGKLCQLFTTADETIAITRELGGKGFAFCVLDRLAAEEVPQFLDRVYGHH